ncbi:MAG: hypothetical protein MJZ68_06840 [archaeon]|nr:hypothetical protein [archaeon]
MPAMNEYTTPDEIRKYATKDNYGNAVYYDAVLEMPCNTFKHLFNKGLLFKNRFGLN